MEVIRMFNPIYRTYSFSHLNRLSRQSTGINFMQKAFAGTSFSSNFNILQQDQSKINNYYGNIHKMNNALYDFKDVARDLYNASFNLTTQGLNGFGYIVGNSTSANIDVQAFEGAKEGSYDVEVTSLSQTAKMDGSYLMDTKKIGDYTGGGFGYYNNANFDITNDADPTKTINIDLSTLGIDQNTTSSTALNTIASDINTKATAAGLDVTAVVESDGSGNSRLVLESSSVDPSSNFSVTDVGEDFAEKIGINTTTSPGSYQSSQLTNYSIDGVNYQSTSHTVSFHDGYGEMTFSGTTSGVETVDFAPNSSSTDTMYNTIKNFVEEYNNMIDFLDENKGLVRSDVSLKMKSASTYQKPFLDDIGIDVKSSGKLEIDETKLKNALTNDSVEVKNMFQNSYKSLGTEIKHITDNIVNTPYGTYANNQLFYNKPNKNHSFRTITDLYSNQLVINNMNNPTSPNDLLSTGLLLNKKY